MLTINNTLDGYLKNVEIKGNTTQDPNNLADIKSVGDKLENQELYEIPLLSRGENLYNGSVSNKTTTGFSFTVPSYLKEGTYYLSFKTNTGYDTNSVYLKSATPVYSRILGTITRQSNGRAFGSITLTSEDIQAIKTSTNNLRIEVYRSTTDCDTPSELMFCTTNTSTYSLYQEHKLTILSPCQLEKDGDVADRIIEKDGVWGVEKSILHTNVLSDKWVRIESLVNTSRMSWHSDSIELRHAKPNSSVISNCLPYKAGNDDSLHARIDGSEPYGSLNIWINKVNATQSDVYSFAESNNAIVKYATTTPQFIPLPHAQQIKLRTFANKTNISFLCETEGTIKADVPKSLGATVNTHTTQIDALNKDLERVKKLEESTVSTVVTDKDFVNVEQTSNGYFEDIELKGRTLVNKFSNFKKDYQLNSVVSDDNKGITLTATNSATHSWFKAYSLEVGKIYTLSLLVKTSTIDNDLFIDQGDNKEIVRITNGITGVLYKTFKYEGGLIRFKSSNNSNGVIDMDNIILLEGDHTQNPPSYFTGIQSVGDGVDEIVVSSVGENLLDKNTISTYTSSDTAIANVFQNGFENDFSSIANVPHYKIDFNIDTFLNLEIIKIGSGDIILRGYKSYEDLKSASNFVFSKGLKIGVAVETVIPKDVKYIAFHRGDSSSDIVRVDNIMLSVISNSKFTPRKTDKKQLLFLDDVDNTWKKPILDEFSTVKKGSDGVYRYHAIGLNRAYKVGDETDVNCITDMTNTIEKVQEKVYECTNIDLITYANETNYIVKSGVLSPKSTLKVHNNIANVVTLLQKKVSLLENDIKNEQSMQNGMILDTDIRMMDLEFTLEEMLPIKLNLRVNNNMLRGMNEFMLMKDRIECGEYTDEYLEKCINKYKRAGRLTDEEYNDLYNMIYPLEF